MARRDGPLAELLKKASQADFLRRYGTSGAAVVDESYMKVDVEDRPLRLPSQARMACDRAGLTDVLRQQPCSPQFMRIIERAWLAARQLDDPAPCLRCDAPLTPRARPAIECRDHAAPQRPFEATLDRLMGDTDFPANGVGGRHGQQHALPLDPAACRRSRTCDGAQLGQFLGTDRQIGRAARYCQD